MIHTFRSDDWDQYRMVMREPHRQLESLEAESAVVGRALEALREVGVLAHTDYDPARFLALRQAVADSFEIPWTAITPRMQRLIWAINAIARPATMVAAGVFCGNTFISNAGAAIGPGAVYRARDLVGVEIKPEQADRARRNVARLAADGPARILAADAVDVCRDYPGAIDLLYLDADGPPPKGKGIYLDILQAAYDKMPTGSLVLAHNSVNAAERLAQYLAFVRDEQNMQASVNVIFDAEGLEVSLR
jgi:predicted O-methyltransferase YrrM